MIESNATIRVFYSISFVFVVIGAINWLVFASYRIHHRSTHTLEPIEDLFTWLQHIVPGAYGQEITFWIQNVVYILVGIAGLLVFLARLLTLVNVKEARVGDARRAYV